MSDSRPCALLWECQTAGYLLQLDSRSFSFALSFALTRPLCLVLLAPPQARHKGWTGQARWLKLNANTSELGGEGQPEPDGVVVAVRVFDVAAG